MAGKGTGLVAFALILSVIALGLGGYTFYDTIFRVEKPQQEIDTYWVEENTYFPSLLSEEAIPSMEIVFNVTRNSSLYVMFNCYVLTNVADWITARIFVNGEYKTFWMRITTTGFERVPLALQYSNTSIIAGTYNITVHTQVGALSSYFYGLSLYAQTITLL